jgi:hypothetical protein
MEILAEAELFQEVLSANAIMHALLDIGRC